MSTHTNTLQGNAREHFELLLQSIDSTGQIRVFWSLSEISEIITNTEVLDIPRSAFNLMALSTYVACGESSFRKDVMTKLDSAYSFIQKNKHTVDGSFRVFTELYLTQATVLLKKDRTLTQAQLEDFFVALFSIENIYSNSLLANKLIVFYEYYKTTLNLSRLERLIGNLKSAMLYLISSDRSEKYAFFHFADMVVWSKGMACHEKICKFITAKVDTSNLEHVSSSGLAYVAECFLSAGKDIPQEVIFGIDACCLTKEKNYLTTRSVPYGLYLTTRYENTVCLDTNAHVLLGLTRKYV